MAKVWEDGLAYGRKGETLTQSVTSVVTRKGIQVGIECK